MEIKWVGICPVHRSLIGFQYLISTQIVLIMAGLQQTIRMVFQQLFVFLLLVFWSGVALLGFDLLPLGRGSG